MKTFTFIKRNRAWYLRLPPGLREYNQSDFARVERGHGAFDELAGGKSRVAFSLDTQPLERASVLELETLPTGRRLGGFYRLRNAQGVLLRHHLGLLDLSLLLYGELAERIYLRKR